MTPTRALIEAAEAFLDTLTWQNAKLLAEAISSAKAAEEGVETTPEIECRFCECPIEPCLERVSGWKHKHPWKASDMRCGGHARPASIAEMARKTELSR